jgi:hypothetical protein
MEKLLYQGKFLSCLNFNYDKGLSSIRGVPNPHTTALSKLLFSGYDLSALADIRKFATNSKGNNDILILYFAVTTFLLRQKYTFLDQPDLKKIIKFKNNNIKILFDNVVKFINKPNKKYILNILRSKNDDNLNFFIVDLCFRFLSFENSDISKFFPDFDNLFTVDNDIISLDENNYTKIIDDRGIFLQSFVSKYYLLINPDSLKLLLLNLLKNDSCDLNIINFYLQSEYTNKSKISSSVNIISRFKSIDSKHYLATLHYHFIDLFIQNNYEKIDAAAKIYERNNYNKDENDNFDWVLDDKNEEDVFNLNLHKNARIYLNFIFRFLSFRQDKIKLYNSDKDSNKVNISVYGGSHSMSWHGLNTSIFKSESTFFYTDFFQASNFLYDCDNFKDFLINRSSFKIITFDIFNFLKFTILKNNEVFENNNHILKYLESLFTIINNNTKDDIYIQSIPFLNDTFCSYIDVENINHLTDKVNLYLKDLCIKFNFHFVDINDYFKSTNLEFNDDNLINNYLIKPDILVKLVSDKIL